MICCPILTARTGAGWWGDLDAEEIWNGWPIGTRLWLLRSGKIEGAGLADGATVVRVEQYIREAIQPFIDRRIASRLDVEVKRVGRERIEARGATVSWAEAGRSSCAIRFSGTTSSRLSHRFRL